jgi:hypothetical protein
MGPEDDERKNFDAAVTGNKIKSSTYCGAINVMRRRREDGRKAPVHATGAPRPAKLSTSIKT